MYYLCSIYGLCPEGNFLVKRVQINEKGPRFFH